MDIEMGGELHYQIAEQEKQQDYEELKRDYDMLSKIYNHDDHADYFELRRHDDGFRITVHLPCGFNIHELRSYCSIYIRNSTGPDQIKACAQANGDSEIHTAQSPVTRTY